MIEPVSKKRFLILGQLPPPFGGQAINIKKMVQVLEKHHFNYRMIPLNFSEELNDMGSLNSKKAIKLIQIFCRLLYALLIFRPHAVYYPPAGPTKNAVYRDFVLLFPLRLLGVKRIFHFHAGGLASLYCELPNWAKTLYRFVYFKPASAICLSEGGKVDPLFLEANNIHIIPSGVEAFQSSSPNDSVNSTTGNIEQNHSDDKFTVLFAGLCSASKGILDFIQVIRQANQQNPNINGVVIGKAYSALEANALEAAEKEGILTFKGIVTGWEKEKIFLTAKAFLFPSIFESENFPTVIIEAFAAGLPVLSTHWRGIPDLVQDGLNGYLHMPHDTVSMTKHLLQLASNQALYTQLSTQAKSDFETRYTMANFEQLIVAYFNQVG